MRCGGKIVLVTGAQRGIGRSVAPRFAQEGADVALNLLDDTAAVESAVAQIAGPRSPVRPDRGGYLADSATQNQLDLSTRLRSG